MKPVKTFLNISAALLLFGCQGSPKQTGPSGGEIHTLECTGLGRTLTLLQINWNTMNATKRQG